MRLPRCEAAALRLPHYEAASAFSKNKMPLDFPTIKCLWISENNNASGFPKHKMPLDFPKIKRSEPQNDPLRTQIHTKIIRKP